MGIEIACRTECELEGVGVGCDNACAVETSCGRKTVLGRSAISRSFPLFFPY